MKEKRWLLAILLAVVMLFAMAACGDDPDTGGTAADGGGYDGGASDGGEPAEPTPENTPTVDYTTPPDETYIMSLGKEGLWMRRDQETFLVGVYDMINDCWVHEPFIAGWNYPGAGDYILVSNEDGYWGYMDLEGNMVIGLMYRHVEPFQGDYAIVHLEMDGQTVGVIDRDNNFVVKPMFSNVIILENYVLTQKNDGYGLYTYGGVELFPATYGQIDVLSSGYIAVRESYNMTGANGKLYDGEGNALLGTGEFADWRGISVFSNGTMYVLTDDWDYIYVDKNLEPISDLRFWTARDFNKQGLAVAEEGTLGWLVLNKEGEILVSNLPEYCEYEGATQFHVYGKKNSQHIVLDVNTLEYTVWSAIHPIDGTNYVGVKDGDTGLWGLYDGDVLYPAVCNNISWKRVDGVYHFYMTRGAEEIEYIPVN